MAEGFLRRISQPFHLALSKIVIRELQKHIDDCERTVEKLMQSEQQFRLLIEGVQDYAIYLLDPDGLVATWNTGAQRIKRYRAEEIIGQHFSRFYTPDDIQAGRPNRALEIASTQGRYEEENWRVRKDGSVFWASVLITALRDRAGKLYGFAKVVRDRTERREAEQRLGDMSVWRPWELPLLFLLTRLAIHLMGSRPRCSLWPI